MMSWRLVSFTFLSSLALAGCQKLDNAYDRKSALCGTDFASDETLLRVQNSEHEEVSASQLQALGVSAQNYQALATTAKGCVRIPSSLSLDSVFIRTADGSSGVTVPTSSLSSAAWLSPVFLNKKPDSFAKESLQASCGEALSAGSTLTLKWLAGGSKTLTFYRTHIRIRKNDQVLWTGSLTDIQMVGSRMIALPNSLPDDDLILDVSSENAFDTAFKNVPAALVSCPFRVDTHSPEILELQSKDQLAGYALSNKWQSPLALTPGALFSFQFRDATAVTVKACLKAGSAAACTLDDFQTRGFSLNAPNAGIWTLSYYFVDAVGHQSPTTTKTLAIVDDKQIQSLKKLTKQITLSVLSSEFRKNISSLLSVTSSYLEFAIPLEWQSVSADLKNVYMTLGSRLERWDHLNLHGERLSHIAFNANDGRVYLSYDRDLAVDVLGSHHDIVESFAHISTMYNTSDKDLYLAFLKDDSIATVSASGGVQKVLANGPFDATYVTDDQDHIVYLKNQELVVIDVQGRILGKRAQATPLFQKPYLSKDASALLLTDINTNQATLWKFTPSTDKVFQAKPNCSLGLGILSDDGKTAYLSLSDMANNGPFILIKLTPTLKRTDIADEQCGLIAWNPEQNKTNVLTYDGLGQILTPQNVSALSLTPDRQTLIAATGATGTLVLWNNGQLNGRAKNIELNRPTTNVTSLAIFGESLVAMYATGEILRFTGEDFQEGSSQRVSHRFPLGLGQSGQVERKGWVQPDQKSLLISDDNGNLEFHALDDSFFQTIPGVNDLFDVSEFKSERVVYYRDGMTTIKKLALGAQTRSSEVFFHSDKGDIHALKMTSAGLVIGVGASWMTLDPHGRILNQQDIPGYKPLDTVQFVTSATSLIIIDRHATSLWQFADDVWTMEQRFTQQYDAATWNATGDKALLFKSPQNFGEGNNLDLWDKTTGSLQTISQQGKEIIGQTEFMPFSADGREWLVVLENSVSILGATPLTVVIPGTNKVLKARFLPGSQDLIVLAEKNNAAHLWRVSRDGTIQFEFAKPMETGKWLTLIVGTTLEQPIFAEFENSKKIFSWNASGKEEFILGDVEYPATFSKLGSDFLVGSDDAHSVTRIWPLRSVDDYRKYLCETLAPSSFNSKQSADFENYRTSCSAALPPDANF